MNTHIFISYTSRNCAVDDATLKKAKELFSAYSEVFVDRLSDKTWWHPQLVIIARLLRSHLIVVIESRSVYRSPWVRFELLLAKLTLTPVIYLPVTSLAVKRAIR